ncbi:MAG: DPP IV N-terminal domain-containing protein [Bacteroidales bacterium]
MKKKGMLILGVMMLLNGATCVVASPDSMPDSLLTLTKIYHAPEFKVKGVPALYNILEGNEYYQIEKGSFLRYIPNEKKKQGKKFSDNRVDTILTEREINKIKDTKWSAPLAFLFNSDKSELILLFNKEMIYRHSSKYDAIIWKVEKNKNGKITCSNARILNNPDGGDSRVQEISFSPDGEKIAFVRNNNLYWVNLSSMQETPITKDGQINKIIHGHTDWVYEEEFAFTKAYDWSSNSQQIAYLRLDESAVKEYSMTLWGELYPKEYKYKYPKAGEDNSKVSVWIYNIEDTNSQPVTVVFPADSIEYFPRIFWSPKGNSLFVYSLNRHQNHFRIWSILPNGKDPQCIYEEKSPTYVEIDDNFYMFKDESKFIISSERNGFRHLYLYDYKGNLLQALTNGNYEVQQLYTVDEAKGKIYFQAAYSASYNKEVMSVDVNGKNLKRLAVDLQRNGGVTHAFFSKDAQYVILQHSKANIPPMYYWYFLGNKEEQLLSVLEDNRTLEKAIHAKGFVNKEFFTIKVPGDTAEITLNAWIMKPDSLKKGEKYPVLMFLYGGPGSQQVLNQYGYTDYLWYEMLVQKGYVVVCVDNRGTGGRGESFKKCTYLQLGKYETLDQIAAAKYLAQLPYVDSARIGIWGWSYGGFMSSACLFKGYDVFKMAMAVAPVTNWKFYDNVYTERFMRTPQENKEGYENNSPINMVDSLQGKYLLIHGSSDDNVHLQNSMDLITALQIAGKPFEFHIYPNKNHSIYGGNTREHLYNKLTEFILRNL